MTPRLLMKLARRATLAIAAALTTYFAAALVLGLLPVNAGFRESDDGITIFVRSNGVHAGIAMPVTAGGIDWRGVFPAGDFAIPPGETSYIGFGWGDRDFYLETRTWADVRLAPAAVALLGLKPTVMHVEHMEPRNFAGERVAVKISAAQYERLAGYIRSTLRLSAAGAPVAIPGARYGGMDAFYEANGAYSFIHTCNEWVRRGLATAGVRAPWWSPFDTALFYQLRELS